ncbi:MAG: dTMP kinase [Phycisphaeraceae bacterium]|nr:dTMP kinase [Phycisphaeraceae bacterium]
MPSPAIDPTLTDRLRGKFVVFDGPDGSGKSTQLSRFIAAAEAAGLTVCEVREPGGTHIGEEIRKVLLDAKHEQSHPMDLRCEMMLFMASRAQLITQRVEPAIQRGELVIADRFISSTLAYQGSAGGLPIPDILAVGRVALGKYWPDLVVVFDVDEKTAQARMNPLLRGREFDASKDRIESKGDAFHRRVRQGYLEQAEQDPNRYLVIDATREPDPIYGDLISGISGKL